MLEECGLPYKISPVFLSEGDQYREDFLERNPNNKIPVLIDHVDGDSAGTRTVFESGAILLYLAEKTGSFMPADCKGRFVVIQWLMWQMSGLGPMLGQHGHFALYASEKIPYAMNRFRNEATRLYGVLDKALQRSGPYIAGSEYSIADIACFPWVMTHKAQQFNLDDFPSVKAWFAKVRHRPQVQAGLAVAKDVFAGRKAAQGSTRDKLFGLTPPISGSTSLPTGDTSK
jgi:GST-like protein